MYSLNVFLILIFLKELKPFPFVIICHSVREKNIDEIMYSLRYWNQLLIIFDQIGLQTTINSRMQHTTIKEIEYFIKHASNQTLLKVFCVNRGYTWRRYKLVRTPPAPLFGHVIEIFDYNFLNLMCGSSNIKNAVYIIYFKNLGQGIKKWKCILVTLSIR